MSIIIWSNASFPVSVEQWLGRELAGERVIRPGERQTLNLVAAAPDPQFFEAEVAFGQPDPGQVMASEKLKWVHLTSAGYTRYDRDDLREVRKKRGSHPVALLQVTP